MLIIDVEVVETPDCQTLFAVNTKVALIVVSDPHQVCGILLVRATIQVLSHINSLGRIVQVHKSIAAQHSHQVAFMCHIDKSALRSLPLSLG